MRIARHRSSDTPTNGGERQISKKRLAGLAAFACAALAAAGVAVAAHRAQSTQAASATFTATTVSHVKATTCTVPGSGGHVFDQTIATYTGTASSSDGRLNGPLTIRAHSVVDASTGLGWLQGTFRVRGSSGASHGTLHAAVASGNAVGSVVGVANKPHGKLVATFAAAFTPGSSGGFSAGNLGGGSVAGAGIVFQHGACKKAHH